MKAHEKIKAKHLATGDRVRFSRDGWQTVERMTNCNSISISFMFSDGVIRKLEAHQEYDVEKTAKPPEPQPGQIMRLQKESNRISLCASHSLFDLGDISESFRAIRQKDGYSNSAAAFQELERGATLHTRDAIYWMPMKWSGEATFCANP
jgi:DNA-binding transcriptional LysR family regulator